MVEEPPPQVTTRPRARSAAEWLIQPFALVAVSQSCGVEGKHHGSHGRQGDRLHGVGQCPEKPECSRAQIAWDVTFEWCANLVRSVGGEIKRSQPSAR